MKEPLGVKPVVAPCKVCGVFIFRHQPNRKLCVKCARRSLRISKALWQAKFRSKEGLRKTSAGWESEEAQRERAAFSEDYEEILSGDD